MGRTIDAAYVYGYQEDLKKLEEEFKKSIRDIAWTDLLTVNRRGEATVAVDAGLIAVKVLDDVIVGAEDTAVWRDIARVEEMTTPKLEVPLITPDDFKVYKGRGEGPARAAGGGFDRIELDCSEDNGMYRVELGLGKSWLRDYGARRLGEALRQAGAALSLQVAKDIMAKYETDVDTNMTDTVANWGNDAYKALIKGGSLIRAKGMSPTVAIVNPDEEYDVLILDYFIQQDYARVAHALPIEEGVIGYLYGRACPIISTRAATAASMTIAAKEKACVIGVRQDIQIEDFNDVRDGLEGAVITFQADVKSGKDAKGVTASKPTYQAWAVATSA